MTADRRTRHGRLSTLLAARGDGELSRGTAHVVFDATADSVLDDLGVTTLAVPPSSPPNPRPCPPPCPPTHLTTHLAQARTHFTTVRAHLDRSRESIATLTTFGHTG